MRMGLWDSTPTPCRDPGVRGTWSPVGCGQDAVRSAVLTGLLLLGKDGTPREMGLAFPSLPFQTTNHMRDPEQKKMEGLVASALLPTLFGASCSLMHPLPLLSPHSNLLTVLLETLSLHLPCPYSLCLFHPSSFLFTHLLCNHLQVS